MPAGSAGFGGSGSSSSGSEVIRLSLRWGPTPDAGNGWVTTNRLAVRCRQPNAAGLGDLVEVTQGWPPAN